MQQPEAKRQPASNENLALCISFDGDYIFMGDAYKNIKVLHVADAEILKAKERIEDPEKYISVKKLYTNNMNEKVVGIYSLRSAEKNDFAKLSEVERQCLSILSVSESGYLRIYALREKKLLECIAQLNIQDQILKVLPVPFSPSKPAS